MSRQIKSSTVIVFILAGVFFAFFDKTKHIPALAAVNPFGVDPYDAVGSFGVQLAIFGAGLTMLRTFRPYSPNEPGSNQVVLILRGQIVVLLSVAITLAADLVALVRYRSIATASAPRGILITLVGGLALLTILSGWLIRCTAEREGIPVGPGRSWTGAIIVCLASVLILALYPAGWDQSIPGGILTALLGLVIFMVSVWSLATSLFPKMDRRNEDLIDDVVSIYHSFKSRTGFAPGFFTGLEKLSRISLVDAMLAWLNPRKHAWNFIVLIAVGMGMTLALVEAMSEGGWLNVGLLVGVAAVFIGIEGAGILLCYGLLSGYLGLFQGA